MIRSTPVRCQTSRTTRSCSPRNEVGGEGLASPLFNSGCTDLDKVAESGGDRVSFLGDSEIGTPYLILHLSRKLGMVSRKFPEL
jgi:hypothetical protein